MRAFSTNSIVLIIFFQKIILRYAPFRSEIQNKEKKTMTQENTNASAYVKTAGGRVIIPSAAGPNKGLQPHRDNTVASPSTAITPEGSKQVGIPSVGTAGMPLDTLAEGTPDSTPVQPLSDAPSAYPGAKASPSEQAPPPPPPVSDQRPRVSVLFAPVAKEGDTTIQPAFRARYHHAVVSDTVVVLIWDTRFEYADEPYMPYTSVGFEMNLRIKFPNQPERSVPVAYFGLTYELDGYAHSVFPISSDT
jgi:hypothetical protein